MYHVYISFLLAFCVIASISGAVYVWSASTFGISSVVCCVALALLLVNMYRLLLYRNDPFHFPTEFWMCGGTLWVIILGPFLVWFTSLFGISKIVVWVDLALLMVSISFELQDKLKQSRPKFQVTNLQTEPLLLTVEVEPQLGTSARLPCTNLAGDQIANVTVDMQTSLGEARQVIAEACGRTTTAISMVVPDGRCINDEDKGDDIKVNELLSTRL